MIIYESFSIKARQPKKYARGKWYQGILYDGYRFDPNTVPEGYYLYHLRHGDGIFSVPITIEKNVLVNFLGSFLCKEKLPIAEDYLEVQDYNYNRK